MAGFPEVGVKTDPVLFAIPHFCTEETTPPASSLCSILSLLALPALGRTFRRGRAKSSSRHVPDLSSLKTVTKP